MKVQVISLNGGLVNFGDGLVAKDGDIIEISAPRARVLETMGIVKCFKETCGGHRRNFNEEVKPVEEVPEKPEEKKNFKKGHCKCCGMMPKLEGQKYRCPRDGKLHVRCKYWREP